MRKKAAVTSNKKPNQHLKYPIPDISRVLIVLVLCGLLLALTIALNVTILTPLFLAGLTFIYDYQTSQSEEGFRVIHNLISLPSQPIFVGVFIIIYFLLSKRRLLVASHLVYYIFCTYIIAVLVQGIQQIRPNWYDTRIKMLEWGCLTNYANPSGHCYSVVVLYEPILSDFTGYLRWKILAVPLVILWVIMPLSRMYLGMHSANQVLFGLTLGMIFLILYKYIFQKELYELCWQFLTGTRRNCKIVAVLCAHILVLVIPIVLYLTNKPMHPRDLENLNKQCGVTDITNEKIQEDMFVSGSSIGSLCFGLLYGFIFLVNKSKYRLYYLGKWYYRRKLIVPLTILL